MKHFIFFLYVLALISSFLATINVYVVYLKTRNTNIKRYLQATVFFIIMNIMSFFFTYLTANFSKSGFIKMEYMIILHCLSQSVLIYYAYKLYSGLFARKITKNKKIKVIIFSFVPIVYLIISLAFFKSPLHLETAFDIWILIFSLYFLISIVRVALYPEKHQDILELPETKKIVKTATVFYILLSSVALIMTVLSLLKINPYFLDNSYFAFFNIAHNVICIFYSFKFFTHQLASARPEDISPVFIETFNITQREKEIVEKILQGKSNKEIAGELALVEGTIKVFVYNIFQKTGVKNRVELTHLARTGILKRESSSI